MVWVLQWKPETWSFISVATSARDSVIGVTLLIRRWGELIRRFSYSSLEYTYLTLSLRSFCENFPEMA